MEFLGSIDTFVVPVDSCQCQMTLYWLIGVCHLDHISPSSHNRELKAVPDKGKPHVCPQVE